MKTINPLAALAAELSRAVDRWRESEPGSRSRQDAADEIEQLEAALFGDRPHALGKPLED